jgi:hypothetical protein
LERVDVIHVWVSGRVEKIVVALLAVDDVKKR